MLKELGRVFFTARRARTTPPSFQTQHARISNGAIANELIAFNNFCNCALAAIPFAAKATKAHRPCSTSPTFRRLDRVSEQFFRCLFNRLGALSYDRLGLALRLGIDETLCFIPKL